MTTEFDEVARFIKGVRGWLAPAEAEALFEAAKSCTGRGVIVEIGSWKGKSTICLARGSQAGACLAVYAIDRHTDRSYEAFQRNITRAGVADRVHPIRSRSQDAADGFSEPVELLFVDGAHAEALVREASKSGCRRSSREESLPSTTRSGSRDLARSSGKCCTARTRSAPCASSEASTSMARTVSRNTRGDRARARLQLAKKTVFWLVSLPGHTARRRLPQPLRRFGRRVLGLSGSR